jgi:transposase-like protein
MPKASKRRSFSREFKLKVIARLDGGERGSDLARELSIKRTIIYRWRDAVRRGGKLALRSKAGRPNKAEARAMAIERGVAAKAGDLAEARRQIATLEAKVGRQQLDLDFFKQALQRIEASRRPSERSGATASSPKSKR